MARLLNVNKVTLFYNLLQYIDKLLKKAKYEI